MKAMAKWRMETGNRNINNGWRQYRNNINNENNENRMRLAK
jgi:hypothetical protein